MEQLYKYNRTSHLAWSEGATNDDKIQHDLTNFIGKEIVISEKMDGENCLDGDTKIFTKNGVKTIKEICDNKYFGNVLSYNQETNSVEFKKIINHFVVDSNINDEWFEIELENKKIIRLTGNHYVYLPLLNVYRKVCDLNENDEILFLPEN